jgi:hypothetical protein
MITAVAAGLAEIVSTLATIQPQHEGLRDFGRLNLKPATQVEVTASLEQYDRRVHLLAVAQAALEALLDDGYPELAPREVAETALKDLQENARTIDAALQQFASNSATALGLDATDTEPK